MQFAIQAYTTSAEFRLPLSWEFKPGARSIAWAVGLIPGTDFQFQTTALSVGLDNLRFLSGSKLSASRSQFLLALPGRAQVVAKHQLRRLLSSEMLPLHCSIRVRFRRVHCRSDKHETMSVTADSPISFGANGCNIDGLAVRWFGPIKSPVLRSSAARSSNGHFSAWPSYRVSPFV